MIIRHIPPYCCSNSVRESMQISRPISAANTHCCCGRLGRKIWTRLAGGRQDYLNQMFFAPEGLDVTKWLPTVLPPRRQNDTKAVVVVVWRMNVRSVEYFLGVNMIGRAQALRRHCSDSRVSTGIYLQKGGQRSCARSKLATTLSYGIVPKRNATGSR